MFVTARDGTRLHVEEAGSGTPILFIHEFGGNHLSWEPQLTHFARNHRVITYAARGYPPSDVPEDIERYSQRIAAEDAVDVLDGLGIDKAHIVGLSMGGFATLHVGLIAPERCLSLTVAGAGYGCEKETEEYFRQVSLNVADNFEKQGSEAFAKVYALGASRVQFQNKDPRGWQAFADRLATHSSLGAAMTMRGVQARRPSYYDLEAELKEMMVPTLVMVGDEDDHCLKPGLFLKRVLPAAGLAILPKTGHTLNLEEPIFFNLLLADFLAQVEAGRWGERDPRANPAQIMRTD
ncbi:2-hydroxy-6-oxononadienedioate/2-hydroxy-6-oxononatrienedioate hydrolase [Hartmannibacter diazotrophicus]|uniref:2-hydroxy-6-oxononadienedioate/2-hydroxy-6-oxononatrienedioate hydrolase n=1 Tax=Hartmannibacter diazotrophicus TaxID=1482074 RepID=A0A2C9D9D0_9HYPH|nr:alpha/beta hydrolase [Hartmannibacter diazotrophicus]SON56799.1 2-hydroxy-6-oxononadienedioate/2-hydroxy-6-oxononatrienedioate hydrolase [Hartmannibacter diazotrophicus]